MPFWLQPCLVDGKVFAIAQYNSSLNDILKLVNVAGPVIGLKQLQVFFCIFQIVFPAFFA